MSARRAGDWIQVRTGRQFWPVEPRPGDVDLVDICIALSKQCRFSGHCNGFYSVAQHSVLVSLEAERRAEGAEAKALAARWGLLHDASEAYLVDLPKPLKKLMAFEGYREIERRVQAAVCERFGLALVEPTAVKVADLVLLATEARDLMAPLHDEWEHKPPAYEALSEVVRPVERREAAALFWARAKELFPDETRGQAAERFSWERTPEPVTRSDVVAAARRVVFDARDAARDWPIGDTDEERDALEALKVLLRKAGTP